MLSNGALFPAAALVLFLIGWELFSRQVDPILFPSPLSVLLAYGLVKLFASMFFGVDATFAVADGPAGHEAGMHAPADPPRQ